MYYMLRNFTYLNYYFHIKNSLWFQKKTGRPLGLFSELLISHNLQINYETTLDKTQSLSADISLYPFLRVVQSKTNRQHHLIVQ